MLPTTFAFTSFFKAFWANFEK